MILIGAASNKQKTMCVWLGKVFGGHVFVLRIYAHILPLCWCGSTVVLRSFLILGTAMFITWYYCMIMCDWALLLYCACRGCSYSVVAIDVWSLLVQFLCRGFRCGVLALCVYIFLSWCILCVVCCCCVKSCVCAFNRVAWLVWCAWFCMIMKFSGWAAWLLLLLLPWAEGTEEAERSTEGIATGTGELVIALWWIVHETVTMVTWARTSQIAKWYGNQRGLNCVLYWHWCWQSILNIAEFSVFGWNTLNSDTFPWCVNL